MIFTPGLIGELTGTGTHGWIGYIAGTFTFIGWGLEGAIAAPEEGGEGGLNVAEQRENGFNAALPVPLDSVQEFRVTVSGQNATQGRSSGGQVSLVTKSGTNLLHGSAYVYNRDTAFSANNLFRNRSGIPREQLKPNQYGVSLGGPVKKDRAFFFFNVSMLLDKTLSSEVVFRFVFTSWRRGL